MNYTKTMKQIIVILVMILAGFVLQSQTPTPGVKQTKSIVYTNAIIHVGDGTKILDGAIGFDNGVISFLGKSRDVRMNLYTTVIDVTGQHIYPGFIAPNSTLGLQEIGSVRATRDQKEIGEMNPHIRSVIAFQTESEITPTVRTNGVLIGQVTPRGKFVAGQSSVVHFDSWNWEDALISEQDGIHVYWPRIFERDHTGEILSMKQLESYTNRIESLRSYLNKAKVYDHNSDSISTDLRLAAFSRLLENEMTLYVHANDAKQMIAAIKLKREFGIKSMHIVGGRESYLVTNLLKENGVGVMIGRVHDLPSNNYDDIDLPYRLPLLLEEAGVLWCFENAGDMEQMNSRNLPFYAGTAVAYGLDYEKAVQGLTGNAAEILGVSDQIGSLAVGKNATFIVSEGDALDIMTNNIKRAYIDGREIQLTNRQIGLYKKYKGKYDSLKQE